MHQSVVSGFSKLAAYLAALSYTITCVFALPALPLSLNLSSVQANTTSLLALPNPRPQQEPACPDDQTWGIAVGRPSYDHCEYILSNLYPKDPLARPVLRNFYVSPYDVSHTMPNFKLPYEKHYRSCNIQILLATDFNGVPHDEATWNDLRGAARTILRTCIRGKGLGGVVTRNGMHGNIELVVYSQKSVFAKNQILKYSTDPVARSIAAQELLELIGVVAIPALSPTELEAGAAATQTANATNTSGLATAGTVVETS